MQLKCCKHHGKLHRRGAVRPGALSGYARKCLVVRRAQRTDAAPRAAKAEPDARESPVPEILDELRRVSRAPHPDEALTDKISRLRGYVVREIFEAATCQTSF